MEKYDMVIFILFFIVSLIITAIFSILFFKFSEKINFESLMIILFLSVPVIIILLDNYILKLIDYNLSIGYKIICIIIQVIVFMFFHYLYPLIKNTKYFKRKHNNLENEFEELINEFEETNNAYKNNPWSSLMKAANVGNLEEVIKLVTKGENINFKDPIGLTPLMVAAEAGHFEIVKYLVENGANVNAKDKDGANVLVAAARSMPWVNDYKENAKEWNKKQTNHEAIMNYLRNHGAKQ